MLKTVKKYWQRAAVAADEALTLTRSVVGQESSTYVQTQSLSLAQLEPRILFSAVPLDASMLTQEPSAMIVEVEPTQLQDEQLQEEANAQTTNEVIIIDASIPDMNQFLDDLSRSGRNAEVFVLDADRDGVDQITEILDGRTDVDALHIVSHGAIGEVTLGNVSLSNNNLIGYAGRLASWHSSFASDADILFYGCDLAGDASGKQFVESLSALTASNVAASDDVTGHDSLGGDWNLEFGVGVIDTHVAFSEQFRSEWVATLPANVAPINIAPVFPRTEANTDFVFSSTTANALRVYDEDAGAGLLRVSLSIENGLLTLGDTGAATLVVGTGVNETNFTIEGDLSQINAALDGLTFAPTTDFVGHAELVVSTDDQGNSGTGGAQVTNSRMTILVGTELDATDEFKVNPDSPEDPSDGLESTNDEAGLPRKSVATHDDGSYVIVWTDDTRGTAEDVFVQRFDAHGNRIGQSFRVNTITGGTQYNASVGMDGDGRFAIAWTSGGDIYLRRFEANGTAIDVADVPVNAALATGNQSGASIAVNDAGKIVVTWESTSGPNRGIFYNEFDMSPGVGVGEVNVTTSTSARNPNIDINENGDFVIVWEDNGIKAKRYGSTPGDFNVFNDADAERASVSLQDDGRFVVAWDEVRTALFSTRHISLRAYSSAGVPGSIAGIDVAEGNPSVRSASLASDGNGNVFIAWRANFLGRHNAYAARVFVNSSNDIGIGGRINVSETQTGIRDGVSLAMNDANNFVVAWTGDGLGDTSGVFARQFGTGNLDALMFSTLGSGDAPGITFDPSEFLELGGPSISLEQGSPVGTTSGSINSNFDLFDFSGSNPSVTGMHVVSSDVVLGKDGSFFTLYKGDILFSIDTTTTLNSGLEINPNDIAVFRPMGIGDYGSFLSGILLDNVPGMTQFNAFTLVEQDTQIGDEVVSAGDFLFTQDDQGADENQNVWVWNTDTVGAANSVGTRELLILGADIGIGNEIDALELLEYDTNFGGITNTEGTLLLSQGGGATVAGLAVTSRDVYALTVTTTTLGGGATTANALMTFEGGDVGLDAGSEDLNALSLNGTFSAVPRITLSGASPIFVEDGAPAIVSTTATLADEDAADFDGGQLRVDITSNGTANDRLTIRDEGLGLGQIHITGGTNVHFDGNVNPFATLSGGTSGSDPLVVTFVNSDASFAAVEGLMENIAFDNTSQNPSAATRTLSFELTDGTGNVSPEATVLVQVQPTNDSPVLNNGGTMQLGDIFIDVPDEDNTGTSVSDILTLGTSSLTDVDSSQLGIAIVGADNTNGTWEYSTDDGGTWNSVGAVSSSSGMLLAGDGTANRIRFVPNQSFSGNSSITIHGWDQSTGNNGDQNVDLDAIGYGFATAFSTASETVNVFVDPSPHGSLWFSTNATATVGITWNSGDIVEYSGSYAPGVTSGTFEIDSFYAGDIRSLHYVNTPTTVGQGANSFQLLSGDLLMSFNSVTNLPGLSGNFDAELGDVVLYRPSDGGAYRMLLDNPITETGITRNIHGITLVEKDTVVSGGTTLRAGSFLILRSNDADPGVDEHAQVYVYDPTEVALGASGLTSQNADTLLLDSIGLGLTTAEIQGIELIEDDIKLGDESLSSGQLVLSIDRLDTFEDGDGNAATNLSTHAQDIVVLDITETELDVAGNTVVAATKLFTGSDVGLLAGFDALTIRNSVVQTFNTPPIADADGPYTINEGDSVTFDGSLSFDPDTGGTTGLTFEWDLNNDGSFEATASTATTVTFAWSELVAAGIDDDGSFDVALRVTDGDSNSATDTFTLEVQNVAPEIVINGGALAGTGTENVAYTLTISATDPGNDAVTDWVIDWGDGTAEQLVDAATYTHEYDRGGTYNILVAAVDEDGTHVQNKLVVPSLTVDGSLIVFAPATGRQIDQFGSAQLNTSVEVVIGPNGSLFASSFATNEIWEFDRDGNVIDSDVIAPGDQPLLASVSGPSGIAFDANGEFWVAATNDQKIRHYHAAGFDEYDVGAPVTGLQFHPNGDLFTVDQRTGGAGQLHRLRDGVVTSFGSLDQAKDIAIGFDGNVYVADAGNGQVQVFDVDGTLVDSFATVREGAVPVVPYGLAFGPDELLYVTTDDGAGSSDGDRILRYSDSSGSWMFDSSFTEGSRPLVSLDGGGYLNFLPEHQVTIAHVADTPSVTSTTTAEDTQSTTGLVITPSVADGTETTHYKITGISGGVLYLADGATQVTNGSFITVAQGLAGLQFDPAANLNSSVVPTPTEFVVQASLSASDAGLGGSAVTASINVTEVNDLPVLTTGTIATVNATEDDGFVSLGLSGISYGPGGEVDENSQILTYSVVSLPSSLGNVFLSDGTTQVTTGTYTLAEIQGMQLLTAANVSGTDQFRFSVADNGTTNGFANPQMILQDLTINVSPVNDAPTLSTTPTNQPFIENGSSVSAFSGTSINTVEAGQVIQTVELMVDNVVNGAVEFLTIDNSTFQLVNGSVPVTANGMDISVSGTATTKTIAISRPGNIAVAEAETLIDTIRYATTLDDPGGSRTITITRLQDSGGGTDSTTFSIASVVSIANVNDAPTLTTTNGMVSYIEGNAPVDLFSSTAINVVEAADRVQSITLTVDNLSFTENEYLEIDGQNIQLVNGSATTATGSFNVDVSVAGTQATVIVSHASDMTVTDAENLIDNLAYRRDGNVQTGSRTITIREISDDGGGTDSSSPMLASLVTLVDVNDAPSLTTSGANPNYIEDSSAVLLFQATSIDLVETLQRVSSIAIDVTGIANPGEEFITVDGQEIALAIGTPTATPSGHTVGFLAGTITISNALGIDVADAEELIETMRYRNVSVEPLGTNRIFTIASVTDDGGTANLGVNTSPVGVFSTVSITSVNDEPVISANALDPTFTEGGAAVALFDTINVDLVEGSQQVQSLQLSATGLLDGINEHLIIDSTQVSLISGTTLTTNGYSVVVTGGPTTAITITRGVGFATVDAQNLLAGLRYENTSDGLLNGARAFAITELVDSGGTNDGGDNSRSVNLMSSVDLIAVNDSPSITDAVLAAISEDNPNPPGATIDSLFASGFTDADMGSSLEGVVVVGNSADAATEGVWQYSSNGTSWSNVGTVDDAGNGLAIMANSLVRFVPVLNYVGSPTSLMVRGLDDSYGGLFSDTAAGETRVNLDTSSPSADSPFDSNVAAIFTEVSSTNDSPTITNAFLSTINEDDYDSPGDTVSSLFGPGFVDADSGSSLSGVVVVGTAADSVTEGAWQYSSDGGANWHAIGNVDDSGSGLAIDAASRIRFVPVLNFNGVPGRLNVRGLDNTYSGGFSTASAIEIRQTVDTSSASVNQPFGQGVQSLQIIVAAVNDAPIINAITLDGLSGETFVFTASDFVSLTSDVEGDPLNAILVTPPAEGTLTVNANGSFTFVADAGFIGSVTFSWAASDGLLSSAANTVTFNVQPPVIVLPPVTEETEQGETTESTESEEESETPDVIVPLETSAEGEVATAPSGGIVVILNAQDEEDKVTYFGTAGVGVAERETMELIFTHESARLPEVKDAPKEEQNEKRDQIGRTNMSTDYAILTGPGELWSQLDAVRAEQDSEAKSELIKVGATASAVSGFTVGFVAWAIRGGFFLSGLLTQMPAWRSIDPLLIMQGLEGDGESLAEVLDRERAALDEME